MPMTTRTRGLTFRQDPWSNRYVSVDHSGVRDITGKQITASEGHPFLQLGETDRDIGGDFDTTTHKYGDKREDIVDPQPQYLLGPELNGSYSYQGPLYAFRPSKASNGNISNWPPAVNTSLDDLMELGTTAIARCKPTTSPANLAVGLAELIREGIPSMIGFNLWKDRSNLARGAGSEYLNSQFGWLPLVSDIKDTAAALQKWDKLVSQYERDAGRRVRRGYEFPIEKSSSVIYNGNRIQDHDIYHADDRVVPNVYFTKVPTKYIWTRETTVRRWFAGSFSYHLPTDYNSRNTMRRVAAQATELLGLEITPEVLWNLAPWSWAVDWFGNTGDVLSVISDMASDGLVVNYGYLMEHSIVKDTRVVAGGQLKRYPARDFTATFITERKRRVKATPFGFGLQWESFSPRQIAIATALGLTKLP